MATNSSAESLRGRDSGLRPSGGRGFGGPCSQLFGDARAAPVDVQSLERLDELISRAGHWAHGALLDADDVADERPLSANFESAWARKSNLDRRKRKGTLKTTPGAAFTTQNIHKTLPARSGRQCSAASRNDERTVERGWRGHSVDTSVHRTDISLVYVSVL